MEDIFIRERDLFGNVIRFPLGSQIETNTENRTLSHHASQLVLFQDATQLRLF